MPIGVLLDSAYKAPSKMGVMTIIQILKIKINTNSSYNYIFLKNIINFRYVYMQFFTFYFR